jgi:HEAT repeat protein
MGLFGPPNIEKMKAKRDVEGLIKALAYKSGYICEEFEVRKAAADALGQIGDIRAIQPLYYALHDDNVNSDLAKAMEHALARFPGQIGVYENDHDW